MDNRITDADRELCWTIHERFLDLGIHAAAILAARHRALGAEEERAKVVAWLRGQSSLDVFPPTPADRADAIERGEHDKPA